MFWDYYKDAPEDAKKEIVEHLLESQDRIKEFYKYLYTESGMMDIVYDKKTGQFYSNNPLHEKLDINQISEAYDIQKIMFDGNMNIDPGQRKKILISRMRTNIKKQDIASEAEKKRLLKEISDIDKELKKLGVNPIVY